MTWAAALASAAFAMTALADAAACAAAIAVNNCCADAGVGAALELLEDLPVDVFDCDPLLDVDDPLPVEPDEPLEPDELLEVEPEVPPEPAPEDVPVPPPLAETLPVINAVEANNSTPPVLPPELVIDPLDVILCAVAVT